MDLWADGTLSWPGHVPMYLMRGGVSALFRGGATDALAIIGAGDGTFLTATGSIYLDGFGVPPFEAASEIATVVLARAAIRYAEVRSGALTPRKLRFAIIDFVSEAPTLMYMGITNANLGFSIEQTFPPGGGSLWRVGALDDEPEVEIART